jgi:hypothetical protein
VEEHLYVLFGKHHAKVLDEVLKQNLNILLLRLEENPTALLRTQEANDRVIRAEQNQKKKKKN